MPGAVIASGAVLTDCVVGPGAAVAGVTLERVTVGDDAVVEAAVEAGSRVECDSVTAGSR
jgi:hypothetical protein